MIEHPNIIITFTPDEEIGEGTEKFNFDYYKEHNCNFAYTLDGDDPNIINFENFNAASAVVTIHGKSIHPGSAKNKMINSIHLAMEFASMLPSNMTPECTEKYEGFNHITGISGSCEETKLLYIIRNHDMNIFAKQKETFKSIEAYLNNKYGQGTIELNINDSYFNMKEKVMEKPEVLEYLNEALIMSGLNPETEPIRGGTDGARLSFNGIVTPNIGTGGGNFHGPYEYVDVDEMKTLIRVVHNLLQIISEK
jgi:tripeptide aminopeptidase